MIFPASAPFIVTRIRATSFVAFAAASESAEALARESIAPSILDFGTTGSSTLNVLNSLSISSGVTLTIANWTDAVDFFYSTNNPGATNLGRIVFSGFTGPDTKWLPFDHQITPVPEPAHYGAVFVGALLALIGFRRLRHQSSGGLVGRT